MSPKYLSFRSLPIGLFYPVGRRTSLGASVSTSRDMGSAVMENSESSCTMGFIHKKAPGTHEAEGVEAIAVPGCAGDQRGGLTFPGPHSQATPDLGAEGGSFQLRLGAVPGLSTRLRGAAGAPEDPAPRLQG